MADAIGWSAHTFHIPVMGTGYMIDGPLHVARYGISSAISLVDDVLIEQMRKFHCGESGEPYEAITNSDDDARAHRITAYLNLLDLLVGRQLDALRSSPFEPGSEITRYFEMLPESPESRAYREMLSTTDAEQRLRKQDALRAAVMPGSIDVNIMSKGDRDNYRDGKKLPAAFSDASAALRGYALSSVRSSIVFSAGINPRLYGYAAEFDDFFPNEEGDSKKTIILKVSDFHSAAVQGKFLAKRGLWVSEYRIESGLNCGGHAFATKGMLLGPILAEFQRSRQELVEHLHGVYVKALARLGRPVPRVPRSIRVTVQGGIGTAEEDAFLREHYGADGTGWATPFLLVPEVSNVDDEHLRKLAEATEADVYLSDSSPFGLPFWNLRNSGSEEARRKRIAEGHPGSPCVKGYAMLFNTEFTKQPICTASRQYQKQKLQQIDEGEWTDEQRAALRQSVLAKSCICHDLAGGVTRKNRIDPAATPSVCCGPNIVHFNKVATLDEMVGHIYGRGSLLADENRPHMFLKELAIYIDFLQGELAQCRLGLSTNSPYYFQEFTDNLLEGIEYYRDLAEQMSPKTRERFLAGLEALRKGVEESRSAAAC
ncbi:MAG: hypothetical protein JW888_10195 [Pirellulales bacterium]|nr:hypothetical protein [Pirellulales bacterium]